jgi:hypothetical protein
LVSDPGTSALRGFERGDVFTQKICSTYGVDALKSDAVEAMELGGACPNHKNASELCARALTTVGALCLRLREGPKH